MPIWSAPPPSSSNVWWLAAAVLQFAVLHGREQAAGCSAGVPPNKLVCVPHQEVSLLLFLFLSRHRGDGDREGERRSSGSSRLGSGDISPVLAMEQRRPLVGCRPVFIAPPANPLTEGRSDGAMQKLLFFLPAAVPKGRQCSDGVEATSPVFGKLRCWRCGGDGPGVPSGVVPGDGRAGSAPELRFGPDGVFCSLFRVLHAYVRDWDVLFLFLSPCLSFVPSPTFSK